MIGRWVIALVAANLVWAIWSLGWLQFVGLGPQQQTEPERLQRQLRPESVSIRTPQDAAAHDGPLKPPMAPLQQAAVSAVSAASTERLALPSRQAASPAQPVASLARQAASPAQPAASLARQAASPAQPAALLARQAASPAQPAASLARQAASPAQQAATPASAAAVAAVARATLASVAAAASGVCLQAGPFDGKQIDAVRGAAAALPGGSWRIDSVILPGRWMIYMGRFASADAMRAKQDELRGLGIKAGRPGAAWEPGLSLGRYFSEESAQRGLADLGRKGVRTARVVPERPEAMAYLLRLFAADPTLFQQARGLREALGDKELHECK
ncbi:MAG: hypothetical protein LBE78_13860 [Burkholderiaceae bacterium]|jgi:hypothetical protein|nr:hypothetical protein [Burkholderiaceae bacterium]